MEERRYYLTVVVMSSSGVLLGNTHTSSPKKVLEETAEDQSISHIANLRMKRVYEPYRHGKSRMLVVLLLLLLPPPPPPLVLVLLLLYFIADLPASHQNIRGGSRWQ